ncbi:MAG: hypothetical protein J6336_08270 [Kiritimatiellae bacterium]|nr:hypothetical protein [Kiritimatiellia bacterium]
MAETVKLENGFAEVGAGAWLMGRAQPVAFFGSLLRRRRKGFFLPDRSHLSLIETGRTAQCADADRPFLTHISCGVPVHAVSSKVLVAPAGAHAGTETIRAVPFSLMRAFTATLFSGEWVVLATAGRTSRVTVAEGDTLSVRPESVAAWTGNRPTGFCHRLGLSDILLPRGPKDLMLHFHGPCLVWFEGAAQSAASCFPAAGFRQRRVV